MKSPPLKPPHQPRGTPRPPDPPYPATPPPPVLPSLIAKLDTFWGAAGTLGAVMAALLLLGNRATQVWSAPDDILHTEAQVDSVRVLLENHIVNEYAPVDRRVEFLYCREVERAGETPSVPCLQLIR